MKTKIGYQIRFQFSGFKKMKTNLKTEKMVNKRPFGSHSAECELSEAKAPLKDKSDQLKQEVSVYPINYFNMSLGVF